MGMISALAGMAWGTPKLLAVKVGAFVCCFCRSRRIRDKVGRFLLILLATGAPTTKAASALLSVDNQLP
jgi:hypothetical protein